MSIPEELRSPDPQNRKQALQKLTLEPATPDLLAAIEHMAAHDPDPELRAAALDALDSSRLRALRTQRLMKLSGSEQKFILQELDTWQKQGLIGEDLANSLRSRYRVALKPAVPLVSQAEQPVPPTPASALQTDSTSTPIAPAASREPRPSLAQTLLSETSIKTFLYLGAFFVIAAAVILAALVETLRLPILSLAALSFGGTALAVKKRLPQPSFVLFIVFSFILPINAGVFSDLVGLEGQVLAAYWTFVLLVSAGIWGFATWFYNSRFFSLTMLGGFLCSAGFIPAILSSDPIAEASLLTIQLANLLGLAGVLLLTRKKGRPFGMPAFLLGQIFSAVIVAGLFVTGPANFFDLYVDGNSTGAVWLTMSAAWFVTAIFYIASNQLIAFPLFPWFATAALMPVMFIAQQGFEFSRQSWALAIGWTIWATILTLLSETAYRIGRLQELQGRIQSINLPLALAGIALFLVGGVWGVSNSASWGFALLATAAVVLSLAHIIRPRGWVWLPALVSGLFAYFNFFDLPFFPDLENYPLYQITPLIILLLLPDLILRPEWNKNPAWFYPLRGLGVLMALAGLFVMLVIGFLSDPTQSAVCAMILAGFSLLYALRYQQPILGYIPGALFALELTYMLNSFAFPFTFTALSLLALLYYGLGWALHRILHSEGWSITSRWSGLALAFALVIAALVLENSFEGWLIGIFGILFMAEARRHPKIETVAPALFALGYSLVLFENNVSQIFTYLFGMSILWLSANYAYSKSLPNRPLARLTQITAVLLLVLSAAFLLGSTDPTGSLFWMGLALSIFLLLHALLYRQAWLGYAFTIFLALSALTMSRIWFEPAWLWVLTPLAIIYFAIGLALKNGWSNTFRFSGLGLAALTALCAPFALQSGAGWFVAVLGLLWLAETWLNKQSWAEGGFYLTGLFALGMLLKQYDLLSLSYFFFGMALFLLGFDLIFGLNFKRNPLLSTSARVLGGAAATISMLACPPDGIQAGEVLVSLALTVFFALYAALRRQPVLGYIPAGLLAVSTLFALNWLEQSTWLWPLILLAVAYSLASLALGLLAAPSWSRVLRISGVALGTLTGLSAPFEGSGVAAAIPVAIAASLWAVEAFRRRNVWLGFPTNGLYLMSYFMLLTSLEVTQAQFYSIGAALLGLLMHYLLTRAGSDKGAFVTGLVSQLVLLGTTYIQMVANEQLGYFAALFFQALAVLVYGLVVRSRSLVGVPVAMLVLGVSTVMLFILRGLSTVILIGCTGIVMILVATLAVVLRERLAQVGERLSGWRA
ncbi:MAG: hypothetical protein CVU44_04260 [Chloroflexi bacterium HGW-Chloroflexi-6]|nr:MAG: hypothetical protein CVU44_04260 [Chloroflexi bacterium HGW-Chloroflexi-6]